MNASGRAGGRESGVRGAAAALAALLAASIGACATARADPSTPSVAGWKLQIPGPREVYALDGYSSRYFRLDADGTMRFRLDCSETGYTPNAHYVRSELRHLAEWSVSDHASMDATISVDSRAVPDKVTVLQIHGITRSHANAPPLLRVALGEGDLFAFLKVDAEGVRTEKILLASGVGGSWFRCSVTVSGSTLVVAVDGVPKLTRDLSFWPYLNYFKAGIYPQANEGSVEATFRSLAVETGPAPRPGP